MPSALVDSPTGNTYNLLAALATRLGDSVRAAAAWEAADPDTQTRCAISAYLMIDSVTYEGTPTSPSPTQTRAFPRDGLTDKYGTALAANTTPEEIRQAHALLSYELLVDPELEGRTNSAASSVRRVRAGSAEVENWAPGAFSAVTRFPARVQDLLAAFRLGSDSGLGSEAEGTGAESQFDDCDSHDLTEGLA